MTHDQIVAALQRGYSSTTRENRDEAATCSASPRLARSSGRCGTRRCLPTSRTRPGSATIVI